MSDLYAKNRTISVRDNSCHLESNFSSNYSALFSPFPAKKTLSLFPTFSSHFWNKSVNPSSQSKRAKNISSQKLRQNQKWTEIFDLNFEGFWNLWNKEEEALGAYEALPNREGGKVIRGGVLPSP